MSDSNRETAAVPVPAFAVGDRVHVPDGWYGSHHRQLPACDGTITSTAGGWILIRRDDGEQSQCLSDENKRALVFVRGPETVPVETEGVRDLPALGVRERWFRPHGNSEQEWEFNGTKNKAGAWMAAIVWGGNDVRGFIGLCYDDEFRAGEWHRAASPTATPDPVKREEAVKPVGPVCRCDTGKPCDMHAKPRFVGPALVPMLKESGPGIVALSLPEARPRWVCAVDDFDLLPDAQEGWRR